MSEVIELLQSLSAFKPITAEHDAIWAAFDAQPNVHSVVAVSGGRTVGYGSIVIETKIRGGKMGHIEDIVTHADFRKQGIGKAVVDALFEIAEENGCYKVALQCKESSVPFYAKCDYELSGVAMQRFL
jgi:glucosamine-phosphate N-acetyltransferase